MNDEVVDPYADTVVGVAISLEPTSDGVVAEMYCDRYADTQRIPRVDVALSAEPRRACR